MDVLSGSTMTAPPPIGMVLLSGFDFECELESESASVNRQTLTE
jgi:hypothetical protein